MKILLCDENRGFGGSERYLLELAAGLRRREHAVHLLVRKGSWLQHQLGDEYTATTFSGELDPRSLWTLQRLQSKHGFDVIHCHATRDMVVAAALKGLGGSFRLIKSEHCFVGENRSALLNWSYGRCDQIWPVSQSLQRQMESELGSRSYQVVPNGIVLPSLERKIPDRLRRGRWVGYVSSFMPGKGQDEALRAALPLLKGNPDLNLLLAGDGPTRATLIEQAASLGERVWLPGHVENPLDYLAGMQVVVLPSREETFSLVCLEAMALARPVVAYNVGGVPEVVEDGLTGTLVEAGRLGELRVALQGYLDDPQRAHLHGRNGRQRVLESFDMERVLDHTLGLYA